jgi:hypothetical protein
MDGTQKVQETANTPSVDLKAWDPRTEVVMGKYYQDKRAAIQLVAEEMDLDIKGLKPAEAHRAILDLYAEQQSEELGDVADEPPAEEPVSAPESEGLLAQAMRLRAHNHARWDAIARSMVKRGDVDTPMAHNWPPEAIETAMAEFKAVDDGGEW